MWDMKFQVCCWQSWVPSDAMGLDVKEDPGAHVSLGLMHIVITSFYDLES